jgi:S1-C subfamily serine protease
MPRRPRTPLLASLLAAACIGAGGGAVAYSVLSDKGSTVVRQVTVQSAQPVANGSALSVNSIYQRAYRGVVEITVRDVGSSAEGSGFVYDSSGNIVTNQHVVAGAQSISVKFWNGKTYSAQIVGSDSSTDRPPASTTASTKASGARGPMRSASRRARGEEESAKIATDSRRFVLP